MKKINWFDLLVYEFFFWRWNKIFARRPDLREWFISHLKAFDVCENGEEVKVTVTIEKVQDELDD